jgi:copper transporter 1
MTTEANDHVDSQMHNVFFTSISTPLYSTDWTPKTTAGYAGSCIFLIFFTIIFRSLFAVKTIWENRWRDQAYHRRYIVVANKQPISERSQADSDVKAGVLTVNGVDENIKVVTNLHQGPQPWRFSQDLPRAAVYTLIVGIGYLL